MLQKKMRAFIFKCVCLCIIGYYILILSQHQTESQVVKKTEKHVPSYLRTTPRKRFNERKAREKTLPHAFSFSDGKWRLTNLCKPYRYFHNNSNYPLINYTSKAGSVNIFTHSSSDGISSIINRTGAFEVQNVNRVLHELQKHPQLNFLDIGTNIGQHCIAAALIGRASIAIDAAKTNIQHVCASAHYLNFGQKITLIHNIISDSHDKHEFRYSLNDSDYGSIHVNSDGIWNKMKKKYKNFFNNRTVLQDSIILDDILDLPQIHRFKKVFIKMDVEGHEHRVLLGGRELFKRLDVHGILMEWAWHVNRTSANIIKSIMTELSFKPFLMNVTQDNPLLYDESDSWPQDVLWVPSKYL